MSKNTQKTLEDETDQLVREVINAGPNIGIIGGWPCQDVSVAMGSAAMGISGERSGLWRYLFRAIRLVRPKIAVLENVSALLDRGVGEVFGDLASIGYDTEWHCIQAKAVGLPHKRERLYAITYPACQRLQRYFPKEIHGKPEFSFWQNYRSVEELPRRSNLYSSTICGSGNGIGKRLHAIGNGNPPEIITQITKGFS